MPSARPANPITARRLATCQADALTGVPAWHSCCQADADRRPCLALLRDATPRLSVIPPIEVRVVSP